MVVLPNINRSWDAEPVIVAASGPSLKQYVVQAVRMARWLDGWRVLVVNDAVRSMPWADALYAADMHWWQQYQGVPEFQGMRYTSHGLDPQFCDDKVSQLDCPTKLHAVWAHPGQAFSTDPHGIHYGDPPHSGFQAVNLALLLGASRVVLVGFDYQFVGGESHFFGDHPPGLRQVEEPSYREMARAFDHVHVTVPILNASPTSALDVFPQVRLDEALRRPDHRLPRDGSLAHPRAG